MQTITVDMTPGFRQPTIHYSQNDVGTTFAIGLRSRFGDTLPASPTVKIQATKPSGFGFSIEADSVVDSVATFTTVATMTDEAGRFQAELEVSDSGVVLYTANFYMEGEANPHPIGTTDGSQETIIPTLTLLVERVEAAASSVLDMTVNATTLAAGSQATYSYDEATNTATFGIPQGEAGAGAAGVTASAYSSSKTYAVGDYVIHSSDLYRCTTAITTAEAFTAAHWTQVVLGDDVTDLKSEINEDVIIRNYVEDKNLDSTTGDLVDEVGTCTSDFIPYTWTGSASYDCGDNTKLTYRIEFYDSSKNHLQGFRNPSSTGGYTYRGINAEQQVTGTVGYVRFSFKKGTTGKIFTTNTTIWSASLTVVKGIRQMIGDLDGLNTSDKSDLVDAINEVKASVPHLPIAPQDTDFFYTNPNLVNPSDNVAGEYVNQDTGAFTSGSSYTRTDYIPVEAGAKYCIINPDDYNAGIRYAFYTSAKAYISGANVNLSDIGNLVTAPATAAYIAMSANTTRFPFMIAKSNTKISYVEYGGDYILPEYVLGEDLTDLVVNLPSKIYAVTGVETNIYYENIVENWERYNFNVSCSKGQDMKRGYKITPADTDAGSYTLSIVIYTKDWKSSKTVTTTLVIAPSSAGNGQTKSLLVLGDSTTANGTAISKLHENFADDVMSVNTVGTLGTAPNKMEGRGGWTFEFYNTLAERNGVTNPFYNSVSEEFDADYYFTQTSVTKPDWFFINLGINDMFEYVSDSSLNAKIDRCIDWCDGMIASVKSASSASKIGICLTIPPNDSQDAFGKAYKCGQTRNRYKRNNTLWVNRMIAEYDSREAEDIYLIPIHTNLDTVWNMGMESIPVNSRNPKTYDSPIANGGVHPVESGYWQIADIYTAFLKAQA